MIAPKKSTSGEGFRYGRPDFTFPGTTKLRSTSFIGDAIVGARRWTDSEVILERNLLLGDDEAAALKRVQEIRERLTDGFLAAFPAIRAAEMTAYGSLSYYCNQDHPRPPPAEDDISSLSSGVSDLGVEMVDRDKDDTVEEDNSDTKETREMASVTIRGR